MNEKPILFSGPMVEAILAGEKTQTRRVLKVQPPEDAREVFIWDAEEARLRMGEGWKYAQSGVWARNNTEITGWLRFQCPLPYQVGDVLWVREMFTLIKEEYPTIGDGPELPENPYVSEEALAFWRRRLIYRADPDFQEGVQPEFAWPWRPSIFMPRWASRITLKVTAVKVERIQDISEDDCYAEGYVFEPVGLQPEPAADWWFRDLWNSINAKRGFGWDVNPWVEAVTFEVVDA